MNINAQTLWKTIWGSARLADGYGQTANVPRFFKRAVIIALYDVDPLEHKQPGEILRNAAVKRLWASQKGRFGPDTHWNCRCVVRPIPDTPPLSSPAVSRLHRQHNRRDCQSDGDSNAVCVVCEGGLTYCEICNGGEADLPTECPGRKMTAEEREGVANGVLDYVEGVWQGSTKGL